MKKLWSDKHPYDPMTCEMYEEAKAMYNLYEDIAVLKEDLENAKKLFLEADEYLNTNNLTNIGHGSILHDKFRSAGKEI